MAIEDQRLALFQGGRRHAAMGLILREGVMQPIIGNTAWVHGCWITWDSFSPR